MSLILQVSVIYST